MPTSTPSPHSRRRQRVRRHDPVRWQAAYEEMLAVAQTAIDHRDDVIAHLRVLLTHTTSQEVQHG